MGTELNEGERLVKLETEVAVIKDAVLRLEKMLVMREETYVTKIQLEAELRLINRDIEGIQKGLNDLRQERENEKNTNKQVLPSWINNLLQTGAIVVAIIAAYAAFNK